MDDTIAPLTMKAHVSAMAVYNQWANARLYADAAALPEDALHRPADVYFVSLFATLAHILTVDRAWTFLLHGGALADLPRPPAPEGFAALRAARVAQDAVLVDWLAAVDDDWLARPITFRSGLGSWQGLEYRGSHAAVLMHLFNHQTHHRGQAHAVLTRLGVAEPQALDMLVKGLLGQ